MPERPPLTPAGVPRIDIPQLGERIRAARQAAGMTQDQLAAAVGVSRSAVAQWETGRAGQVGGNLAKIAACLRVAVDHLLTGAGPPEGGKAAENGTELALLRLYRACSEADRAFLLRTARHLARAPASERDEVPR